MTGDPLVPVAVLAVRRRASEPVAPPQVDELQGQENPHDQIKDLGMPDDHQTLPGTVARSGDEAANPVRIEQITSTYRAD